MPNILFLPHRVLVPASRHEAVNAMNDIQPQSYLDGYEDSAALLTYFVSGDGLLSHVNLHFYMIRRSTNQMETQR